MFVIDCRSVSDAPSTTDALFPELDLDEPGPARVQGPFAAVALEQAVDKTLTYTVPPRLSKIIKAGQRVKVPLGRKDRSQTGYVASVTETFAEAAAGVKATKLKAIKGIEDERVLVDPHMMELARWIGRYYCCALGLVLESMIPGAVKHKIGVGYTTVVELVKPIAEIQELFEQTKAKKRRSLLGRLLQMEPGESVEIMHLAGEAGVTVPTVKKLAKLGLIEVRQEADLGPKLDVAEKYRGEKQSPLPLTPDQQKAFVNMKPFASAGGFGTHLLLGVTGSGKTEVYLQLMAECVNAGKQAVMLVPEIALTPQTVRRITSRFDRVAVLHSGLTAATRHRYWQQIAAGQADVVVGARSAVFAPVPNLGLLVVDEEHETSYKQDQAPRYHARDVSIKRAQMADCPVILGSATPSLETYERAKDAKEGSPHHLHPLPVRVSDRSMPAIEIQDMKEVQKLAPRKGIHLLSPRLEHLIEHTKDVGQQAILLLNRRGYANFVYNASTDEPVTCKYCDATMTYHRSAGEQVQGGTINLARHTGQLHCHYCLAVDTLDAAADRTGGHLSLFGLGTQRVEEELRRKFPKLVFERVDSDTMRSSKDYENVLKRFADGAIDVLMGTQMIAKGLDFPNVSLVGVISGDTALALPDFRSAERTFQLITQVAGRAGRGDIPGRVVLQTFNPRDPAIVLALKQDYEAFAAQELELRREVGLPPFGRMVRFVLRDQDEQKNVQRSEQLGGVLQDAATSVGRVDVQGPMPAPISRIAGYWRHQIILRSPAPQPLQAVIARVREAGHLASNDRIAVDVDPVSLL